MTSYLRRKRAAAWICRSGFSASFRTFVTHLQIFLAKVVEIDRLKSRSPVSLGRKAHACFSGGRKTAPFNSDLSRDPVLGRAFCRRTNFRRKNQGILRFVEWMIVECCSKRSSLTLPRYLSRERIEPSWSSKSPFSFMRVLWSYLNFLFPYWFNFTLYLSFSSIVCGGAIGAGPKIPESGMLNDEFYYYYYMYCPVLTSIYLSIQGWMTTGSRLDTLDGSSFK